MEDELNRLIGRLANFDGPDLFAALGGLQLIPSNADRVFRLHRVAAAVAQRPPQKSASRVSRHRLDDLVNRPPVVDGWTRSQEDPFEEAWTESVGFFGGNYVVLNGLEAGSAHLMRALTRAIFHTDTAWPEGFLATTSQVIGSALSLSDETCRRAGLQRGLPPMPAPSKPTYIPGSETLARLKHAVTFSSAELSALSTSTDILAPLMFDDSLPDGELDEVARALLRRPIANIEGRIVLLLPTALLTATRHHVIGMAEQFGCLDELAAAFRSITRGDAISGLELLGARFPGIDLGPSHLPITDLVFSVDGSVFGHLIVLTDDLSHYDHGDPQGAWDVHGYGLNLQRRMRAVRSRLRAATSEDASVLHLGIQSTFGRSLVLGFRDGFMDDRSALAHFTSRDFEIVSRLHDFDAIGLWKYGRAAGHLHATTHVMAWSSLDEFALYRERDDSFYLSDDRLPSALNIDPAMALSLRVADVERLDPHVVPAPSSSGYIEVVRQYDTSGWPLYLDTSRQAPQYFLAGFGRPVWVVPSDNRQYGEHENMCCQAIAYWLWQAADFAGPLLEGDSTDRWLVTVQIEAGAFDVPQESVGADWLQVAVLNGNVTVRFCVGSAVALGGPDNSGERELLRKLLNALCESVGAPASGVDAEVDRVAPLGVKKFVITFDQGANPFLTRNVPSRPRLVQANDRSKTLDDLGGWLSARVSEGPLAGSQRIEILNGAVAHLFSELEHQLSGLSSDGLLEYLIRHNEALLRSDAEESLSLPTRIACFGEASGIVERLVESAPAIARASVANRFLIEFVAACPRTGSTEIDLHTYDLLLALAAEIVDTGFLSDAVYFDLSEVELACLPSGRLGVGGADRLGEAMKGFARVQAVRSVVTATSRYPSHWRTGVPEPPSFMTALNMAFEAEFEVSATELADVLIAVCGMASGDSEPGSADLDGVVQHLVSELGVTADRALRLVTRLSLAPRDAFVIPGEHAEVYPWRFNRSWSYLRRPLIVREELGKRTLLWGSRNTIRSWQYLVDLCLTARIKATSSEMLKFVNSQKQAASEAFTDEVATAAEIPGITVLTRVRKFGHKRLQRRHGEDIGDIDVLTLNRSRRRITLIETKDFEFARTPAELSNEVDKLLRGDASAVGHHLERLAWVRKNLEEVLSSLGISPSSARWKVDGFVVVSDDLLTPRLTEARLDILTLNEFRRSCKRRL